MKTGDRVAQAEQDEQINGSQKDACAKQHRERGLVGGASDRTLLQQGLVNARESDGFEDFAQRDRHGDEPDIGRCHGAGEVDEESERQQHARRRGCT